MTPDQIQKLVLAAKKGRKNARAPYSGHHVGAAILVSNGSIHVGCNVENVSYGTTTCAEQVAIYRAVAEGERRFLALGVIGSDSRKKPVPCGICRQVIWEVAGNIEVFVFDQTGKKFDKWRVSDLYPYPYENREPDEFISFFDHLYHRLYARGPLVVAVFIIFCLWW